MSDDGLKTYRSAAVEAKATASKYEQDGRDGDAVRQVLGVVPRVDERRLALGRRAGAAGAVAVSTEARAAVAMAAAAS